MNGETWGHDEAEYAAAFASDEPVKAGLNPPSPEGAVTEERLAEADKQLRAGFDEATNEEADADLAKSQAAALDEFDVPAEEAEPAKPTTFKEAFAAARKRGDATFQWHNGKKMITYSTKLKSEPKPAAPVTAAPAQKAVAAADKSVPPRATFGKPAKSAAVAAEVDAIADKSVPGATMFTEELPRKKAAPNRVDQIPA